MKKILAIIATFAMAVSMVACGNSATNSSSTASTGTSSVNSKIVSELPSSSVASSSTASSSSSSSEGSEVATPDFDVAIEGDEVIISGAASGMEFKYVYVFDETTLVGFKVHLFDMPELSDTERTQFEAMGFVITDGTEAGEYVMTANEETASSISGGQAITKEDFAEAFKANPEILQSYFSAMGIGGETSDSEISTPVSSLVE